MKILDLYCGMGGFSLGFVLALEDAEIHGVDIDRHAVETYNLNLNRFGCSAERADLLVWDLSGSDFDIVVGGPPCQPFSVANTVKVGEAHPLFPTFRRYFELVLAIRPVTFVFENVGGLLTQKFRSLFEKQVRVLAERYDVRYKVLNAADYGVPQKRRRLIAVGVRRDVGATFDFPRPTHMEADALSLTGRLYRWLTVREAIGDLLEVPPVIVHKGHSGGQKVSVVSDGPSFTVGTMSGGGKSRTTIYLLAAGCGTEERVIEVPWTPYQDKHPPLDLDEPSRTVVSHVNKDWRDLLVPLDWPALAILSDGCLRPEGHHDSLSQRVFRRLTVWECMRLQSFPDWWRFPEEVSVSRRYRLVGEAVPPILAYRLAVALGRTLGLRTREPPKEDEWDLPYFRRAFADYFEGTDENG